MNCCEQHKPYGCDQGRDCPVRVAVKAPNAYTRIYTCDELGVCQGNGCTDCDQPVTNATGDGYPLPIWPSSDALDELAHNTKERQLVWTAVLCTALIVLLVLLSLLPHSWTRWLA